MSTFTRHIGAHSLAVSHDVLLLLGMPSKVAKQPTNQPTSPQSQSDQSDSRVLAHPRREKLGVNTRTIGYFEGSVSSHHFKVDFDRYDEGLDGLERCKNCVSAISGPRFLRHTPPQPKKATIP
ncbi:hypothetical protein CONLIGDRAFT_319448 [Coniochaeta ligniaria NRRL 30616]|uniref:Uncharacterized protein n=1 Tax=Coniochaeta ligniaria NRRL 30616 TaxID=1408157 RepID=A0A1J7I404_9PEZI|nr:hypothetical protein CONLIGDRAFT_319448 [Coniochaeta ligniaria NRRL 30616]